MSLEEIIATSTVLYSDALSDSYRSYCASSEESSPAHMPSRKPRALGTRMVMNDKDKTIYNSLGSSSSPAGKPTHNELGLHKDWQKKGLMWKSGPNPSWYTLWKERIFILKDNFLYYFAITEISKLHKAPVLGAIYLHNSIIERVSMTFAKYVIKITPPVPRRRGWEEDDDSSVFHIKFKTHEGREEWFEELQQVAFSHEYPTVKDPMMSPSMHFQHEKVGFKKSF